jgi:hypothetical protein
MTIIGRALAAFDATPQAQQKRCVSQTGCGEGVTCTLGRSDHRCRRAAMRATGTDADQAARRGTDRRECRTRPREDVGSKSGIHC